tara:strand:+ start:28 stop:426 length:399 start_codon:yes stop_codon:yes gene_type:complete
VYSENQPTSLLFGKFAQMVKNGEPVTIHGDGEYRRDYIHVSDVASACIASMESKVKNDTFNVGTGNNISVNEVVDILKKYAPKFTAVNVDKPRGYAPETLADISKTKNLLNWSPKIKIEEGLADMFEAIFKK